MAMIVSVTREKYGLMYEYYKLLKDNPCKKCDRTYRGFCAGCKTGHDYQNKVSTFEHLDNDPDKKTLFRIFELNEERDELANKLEIANYELSRFSVIIIEE